MKSLGNFVPNFNALLQTVWAQWLVKVASAFERKLKRMGETVAVVDSKVISWAWSSSPEVDEVVEDAGRRRPRDVRRLG